jgi:hypothetical protein
MGDFCKKSRNRSIFVFSCPHFGAYGFCISPPGSAQPPLTFFFKCKGIDLFRNFLQKPPMSKLRILFQYKVSTLYFKFYVRLVLLSLRRIFMSTNLSPDKLYILCVSRKKNKTFYCCFSRQIKFFYLLVF